MLSWHNQIRPQMGWKAQNCLTNASPRRDFLVITTDRTFLVTIHDQVAECFLSTELLTSLHTPVGLLINMLNICFIISVDLVTFLQLEFV